MKVSGRRFSEVLAWISALLVALAPLAQAEQTVEEALASGNVKLQFRYRFEGVDQTGIATDANASTLKTRLSLTSGQFSHFDVHLEVDDVSYLGNDRFNNTRNGETAHPVVADPDGTDINQAWVRYSGDAFSATLGRQRINLDDQRFVGGVGWRQNEQTFDALTLDRRFSERVTAQYIYVNRVSRIFGPEDGTPDDLLDSNTHLLHATWQAGERTEAVAYFYGMDLANAAALSNQVVGARIRHSFVHGELRFPVRLEYAVQNDYGDNPVDFDTSYYRLTAGMQSDVISGEIGMESLGGSTTPGEAFRTPLATLHKWQGWTDKFLSTPAQGIEDIFASVSFKGVNLVYHRFDPEIGPGSFGSEWGVSWARKFSKHYHVLLKFADFDADDLGTDTTKFWFMITATF